VSQTRVDELIAGTETYGFDAIRGTQAGHEFYVAMCPLKIIPKLFIFNDHDIPPELRAQRTLRKSRIPAIKNYILKNPDSYIFSSLTASVDGTMKFSPFPSLGQDGKLGRLYISMESRLLINDGQHRRKAIEEALKERPDLGHEMISVVFLHDEGLKRSQQMFSDLNKNAIKPTKSLNILYDHRDEFAKFIVNLVNSIEIFEGRVELTEQERETVKEFWNEVAKNTPEWQLIIQNKVTPHEIRKGFVNTHTNVLNALGIMGNVLIKEHPDKWKEKLRGFKNIDWSRKNPEWDGRLLIKGQMLKNQLGIELTANLMLEKCGVKLSEDRLKYNVKL
jgi:DNA sulfur modification protein DndB